MPQHRVWTEAATLRGSRVTIFIFETKILGVADVVEAMSSHRPYRPCKGVKSALEEVRSARGKVKTHRLWMFV